MPATVPESADGLPEVVEEPNYAEYLREAAGRWRERLPIAVDAEMEQS